MSEKRYTNPRLYKQRSLRPKIQSVKPRQSPWLGLDRAAFQNYIAQRFESTDDPSTAVYPTMQDVHQARAARKG